MRIRLCRPLSLSSLFSFSYFLIYINPMLLSFYKVSKFCSIFSKMVSDSCVIFLIDYFTTSSQNYKSIIIIKKPSLKTELNKKKKKKKHIQWNKCLARVSLGMYSATSNLSSPSQQYPIKLASLWCLNFPTPHASSYNTHQQKKP